MHTVHFVRLHSPESANTSDLTDTQGALTIDGYKNESMLDSPDAMITASVSTAFNTSTHSIPPDIIFATSDHVQFYGHTSIISSKSPNAFQEILGGRSLSQFSGFSPVTPNNIIHIDIPSNEFNVIMHMLYNTSPAVHSPSLATLIGAIDRAILLDVNPKAYIVPNTPIFSLLEAYIPLHPLDIFIMAAHHSIPDLARQCSSHLLAIPITQLTDAQVERMGALYLKRLVSLHLSRILELKTILQKVPEFHPATDACTFPDQRAVSRAWALAAASIIYDASPDIAPRAIREPFEQMSEHMQCKDCKRALHDRLRDVLVRWSATQRTID
ncbi:hypothetical protein BJ165DRAFT_1440615 [Panaeolus papilionaceus]|nr:hypothetical protein BJ165DRAFT_1440615 [Panaeolus papilionaceus]